MEKKLPVIAIDGPSASGKGTIARGLARELGFAHLETGLIYRWVGKEWLKQINPPHPRLSAGRTRPAEPDPPPQGGRGNLEIAAEIAQELAGNFSVELLNDPDLRSNAVAEAASVTSAHPPVRAALLELQRNFAKNPALFYPSPWRERVPPQEAGEGEATHSSILKIPENLSSPSSGLSGHPERDAFSPPGGREVFVPKGAILDGRDIASVVCPDADVKLFATASPEIRAARRTKELQLLGEAATYEQVLQEVRVRDHRDQTREVAPLMPTAGSITIDTSNLSAEDATGVALGIIRRIIPNI